jgi:hypothetical protein
MRKKKRSEQSISDVLREYLGQRTVLGVAIPVLSAHIEAAESGSRFQGLSERQIQQGFRELVGRFIKSDYHSTYIDRRLGRRGFLELSGDRYPFAPLFLKESF